MCKYLWIPVLALLVVGCKGSRDKEVVGTWSAGPTTFKFKEDKQFEITSNVFPAAGTWTMEGNDLTLTTSTIAGKSTAEFKKIALDQIKLVPANQRGQVQSMIDDLDKQNVFTLSDDGKTLTTNKEKDKNSGPGVTLTKS